MNLKDLGLELKIQEVSFKFNDKEIKVKQYLPVEQKAAIVNVATRGALVDGIVSRVLMDAYLHLLIIENYTNIEFSEADRELILETFDRVQSTGFVDLVIENMPQAEYEYLFNETNIHANNINEFYRSFGYAAQSMSSLNNVFSTAEAGQKE
jgi:hypothetical protein